MSRREGAMNGQMFDALAQRLDRLERENRRLRRVGATLAVGVAAVVLMGQARTPARVIEAQKFVLRDESGKIHAELDLGRHGTPFLAFSDQDGKARAGLGLMPDGAPVLRLADRDGKVRAALDVGADGAPGLTLYDQDENPRVSLDMRPDGRPIMGL